jgi:GH25 family lysozyme M1 (1,4-beta-N-acetylmuramidase)
MALCALCVMACAEAEVAPDRSAFTTARYALTACPDGEVLDGIDVSKWQGYIDWNAVAGAGIDFAFIRVSDGLNYQDAYFQSNWSQAKANGVVRGAYQFFRSDEDPVAQAQYLLDEMGPLEPGDLPPVCDVETADGQSPATIIDRIQTWLDVVEGALGVKPLIYTSPGVWGSIVNSGAFSDYPLWVAHWGASCPSMPTGWGDWLMWQTSDSGNVPGINGGVDTDLFNGDMEALLEFAYGDSGDNEPPPPPEETATPCPVSTLGQTLIQEDGPCAKRLGAVVEGAYVDIAGSAGHAWWTTAEDAAPDYSEGVAWLLDFEEGGPYTVWAHVPAGVANVTTGAVFEVQHGGTTSTVIVDPSANIGAAVWLGTFEFVAGSQGQQVQALDSYTVGSDQGARVCFDALEMGPGIYCACGEQGLVEALSCGVDAEMTRVCDGCQWSSWSSCDSAATAADTATTPEDTAVAPEGSTDSAVGPSLDVPGAEEHEGVVTPGLEAASVEVHAVASTVNVFSTSQSDSATPSGQGCQGGESERPHGALWLLILVSMRALWLRGYRPRRVSSKATP